MTPEHCFTASITAHTQSHTYTHIIIIINCTYIAQNRVMQLMR